MAFPQQRARLDRSSTETLDAEDPLRRFRTRFVLPNGLIYMNGNSLGPLPHDTRERMQNVVENEWGNELVRGWNSAGWYDLPWRVGDKIGRLIGAAAGETVIGDSTSVNLFKAVAAARALRPLRRDIVTEAGNFPTDLYILDGLSRLADETCKIRICDRQNVLSSIDTNTAVVVLTHVHYISGALFPMAKIVAAAHALGAIVVWDLSHSVAAVDVDLNGTQSDFAVGCGYKHLNGGPGAPAFIYAAERHHGEMHQPLSGWFGHANPFEFSDGYVPAEGAKRLLCGTTGVLGATALEAGVDVMLEADSNTMFDKTRRMSTMFQQLVEENCGGLGLELVSPLAADMRGAHISYAHEHGYAVVQNLIDRGVVGDFRAPTFVRFGFSPLFMSYTDIVDAVEIFRDVLVSRSYENLKYQHMNSVT